MVLLKAEQIDKRTMISISDNGTGIAEETLEQIFIPFFTTKEKGTGIGLSLSHHIVRMHGGKIEVDSVDSVGTTFSIYLNGVSLIKKVSKHGY